MKTNGTAFTVLHDFLTNGVDGRAPLAELTLSGNTLYGTTERGGTGDSGVLFSVNTDGTSFTILHSFSSANSITSYTNVDGAQPYSGLTFADGILYGTARLGGADNAGTIFSLRILPSIMSLNLTTTNLVLNAINGLAGHSYTVLTSTNAALPLNQWTPVATNVLAGGGNFTLAATNAVNLDASQQFYILQTQ